MVLAEAALETVPEALWNHPAVKRHAKKQRKTAGQLLLDRSLHHHAMKRLDDNLKRGRPDITHFCLLEALGSPLNKEGLLQIYVHTREDKVITVDPKTRLPKNYSRFIGLMEQLFQQGKVPSEGETLLKLEQKTLQQLLAETEADHILAFSREGKPKTLTEAVASLKPKQRPAIIIGAFPHGHLSDATVQLADELVCIDSEMLEAWTVTSRAIYEYEQAISLPKKRLGES
ncbi:MAG: 16S rRNA methyltransferase [Candidatus Bathyarchaeum sp.]|nr:MAG: 16S rRNA methyltransferase [Candidatus Bathyarchaeum sp.]